ncbi:MAG: hypothetical protein ACE5ET_09030 [Gammaproteobacteria bacterium]
MARTLSLLFAAGCLGGLLNSMTVWGSGQLGLTTALGVAIAPQLTAAWLYPRIVWGGLWGALFLLPLCRLCWWHRGLLFSLGPSLVQLFIVFPFKADKGMGGLALGVLTPLFVVLVNAVWGLAAAWWLTLCRGR